MRVIFLLSIIVFMSSCSFHSRQSQVELSKKEKAKEEKLSEQKSEQLAKAEDLSSIKELTPIEKVLNKKINPRTFEQDMKLIEESEIYSKNTCQSFRYSYNLLQASGQKYLDMSYKKALDGAKRGSESAKRIENMSVYQSN